MMIFKRGHLLLCASDPGSSERSLRMFDTSPVCVSEPRIDERINEIKYITFIFSVDDLHWYHITVVSFHMIFCK